MMGRFAPLSTISDLSADLLSGAVACFSRLFVDGVRSSDDVIAF